MASEEVTPDRRRSERRAEVCMLHDGRQEDINDIKKALFDDIKPSVNQQKGQWRILICFFGVIIFLAGLIYDSHKKSVAMMVLMDKNFSAYMAAHKQESVDGFRRIQSIEKAINEDIRPRLLQLEKSISER